MNSGNGFLTELDLILSHRNSRIKGLHYITGLSAWLCEEVPMLQSLQNRKGCTELLAFLLILAPFIFYLQIKYI